MPARLASGRRVDPDSRGHAVEELADRDARRRILVDCRCGIVDAEAGLMSSGASSRRDPRACGPPPFDAAIARDQRRNRPVEEPLGDARRLREVLVSTSLGICPEESPALTLSIARGQRRLQVGRRVPRAGGLGRCRMRCRRLDRLHQSHGTQLAIRCEGEDVVDKQRSRLLSDEVGPARRERVALRRRGTDEHAAAPPDRSAGDDRPVGPVMQARDGWSDR